MENEKRIKRTSRASYQYYAEEMELKYAREKRSPVMFILNVSNTCNITIYIYELLTKHYTKQVISNDRGEFLWFNGLLIYWMAQ